MVQPPDSVHPHDESPTDEPGEVTFVDETTERSPEDERVAELIAHTIDVGVLAEAVDAQAPADAADTLEDLEEEEAVDVVEAMDDVRAAEALAEMDEPLAAGIIEELIDEDSTAYAAHLLALMAPDDAADLLQAVNAPFREQLLAILPAEEQVELRDLVQYEEDSAGGLMTTDFVALQERWTVGQATDAIRASNVPPEANYVPVVDPDEHLLGIVDLRTLLVNRPEQRVADLMDTTVKALRAGLDQEEVAREFDRYDFYVMPVVDDDDRLIGIITVDDVIDIIREEQTEDVQRTVGAGAEEAVYSSVGEKFRGRFPWLVVSLVMMIPSAAIVLKFEGLIGDLAILAVLMPVVAALAGNAGHQALAVTLRGLILDEVRPDRVSPLVRREALVGALTGLTAGVVVGLGVTVLSLFIDSASWQLGIVVAFSMTASMCIGTLAGSGIPLLMKRLGADPAQSSAIFLIMITDAIAFATFLGLAYSSYQWLAPTPAPGS